MGRAGTNIPFENRKEAGQILARDLVRYAGLPEIVLLALPRGGVEVGAEVARALQLPLDVFVVRKLGVPGHEEVAMGALASGGTRVLNEDVLDALNISDEDLAEVTRLEQLELRRRELLYRSGRPPLAVEDCCVILIDDGLATGATMRAAVVALREKGPAQIVVAVPVASPDTCAEFEPEVEELVCSRMPDPFVAVGVWYRHFPQLTDEDVRNLLEDSALEYASHLG